METLVNMLVGSAVTLVVLLYMGMPWLEMSVGILVVCTIIVVLLIAIEIKYRDRA